MRPSLISVEPRWPAGLALVRLIAGGLIAYHGLAVFDSEGMREMGTWLATDLHMPAGLLMAYLAKGTEFFGGLLLAIGLFTRPAAALLIVTMAVAVFGAHGSTILTEGQPALLFLLLFGAFFCAGPGRWSVDYWLSTRAAGR
jgi:putative oxidoreductase